MAWTFEEAKKYLSLARIQTLAVQKVATLTCLSAVNFRGSLSNSHKIRVNSELERLWKTAVEA